jgi:hypothetical protein
MLDQEPVPHGVHVPLSDAPKACEYVPDRHFWHVVGVSIPVPAEYVPTPHLVHWVAVVRPGVTEYVPAGQGSQVLSREAPCCDENFPAPHAVHCDA